LGYHFDGITPHGASAVALNMALFKSPCSDRRARSARVRSTPAWTTRGDRPLGSENGGISTGKMAKLWTKWWISMEELGNSEAKIWKNMGTMGHKRGKHLENMGKLMI